MKIKKKKNQPKKKNKMNPAAKLDEKTSETFQENWKNNRQMK